MTPTDEALLSLLRLLKQQDYRFVTPTPATHARVIARPDRKRARSLEDILGWSLPFEPSVLDPRSEEHTSELQSLMRISYAVFCLKKKKQHKHILTKQHYPT